MGGKGADRRRALASQSERAAAPSAAAAAVERELDRPASRSNRDIRPRDEADEAAPADARERDGQEHGRDHASILEDSSFSRYAYGVAQGAALNPGEPWRVVAAVGRDFGQALLSGLGWKPSGAEPQQQDETKCEHWRCSYTAGRLQKQAEERAAEARQREEAATARRASHGAKRAAKQQPQPPPQPPAQPPASIPEEQAEAAQPATKPAAVQAEAAEGEGEQPPAAPTPAAAAGHERSSSSGGDSSTSSSRGGKEGGGKEGGGGDLSRVSSASHISGDIVTSGQGHYDPSNDVILRLETITPAEVRFMMIVLWTTLAVAAAFLIYLFVRKLDEADAAIRKKDSFIMNTVLGGTCLAILSIVLAFHVRRLVRTRQYGKVWKPRRFKYTVLVMVELFAQWVNLVFFILPNAENLTTSCGRIRSARHVGAFSLVRWTCWNTLFCVYLIHAHNGNLLSREEALSSSLSDRSKGLSRLSATIGRRSLQRAAPDRADASVMDLPFLTAHWWKLLLWLVMEATVLLSCLYYVLTLGHSNPDDFEDAPVGATDCARIMPNCAVSRPTLGISSIMVFFALLYFALYCYFVTKALRRLQRKSSAEYKIGNVIIRLQMRLRLPAFCFFALAVVLLWFVRPFSCNSLIDTWFGLLPGQITATMTAVLSCFIGAPKSCSGTAPILQVWLQEFAWTEAEKPARVAQRSSSLPPEQRAALAEGEPMFCVETMLHCLYWSLLTYDYSEVEDSNLSIEEGCGLFDPPLDHFELFWEKSLDTKMLLAWNRERMVLAFRGTASLANVVADLQAWRSVHQPKRGSCLSRPMVHSGFDKAWRNNRLNERVIARIKAIFEEGGIDKSKFRFCVTGHSLGGALATLAAYDMRAIGKKYGKDTQVSCYTFGAPRTGNHAFARDFEAMVPDCWHVINDQDVVARGGKFFLLYKRGGHRVLINPLGDLIVRPTALEASMRLVPCSGSVQQHLLTSYLRSLLAVLLSQFSDKRLKGGMSGVVALARSNTALKRLLLEEAGLEFKDLEHMMRWGGYAPKLAGAASLPLTGRQLGSGHRDRQRRLAGREETTRGGLCLSCCAPTAVRVKEGLEGREGDGRVTDGSAVDAADKI